MGMQRSDEQLYKFQEAVRGYYHEHGRDLPWRQPEADGSFDPYKILVSELMLQQTQVSRVIPKYHEFLTLFPSLQSLAGASLGQVLTAWSGLGYNRRAKFLHQAAKMIVEEYNGQFPQTLNTLTNLPGIGKNTAGAILVYAFNQPTLFVETNIRSVYIHHFFKDRSDVSDSDILDLVRLTLPPKGKRAAGDADLLRAPRDEKKPQVLSHYRDWYWALMDYGSYLKASHGNLARRSKHYVKQSTFQGSKRQIRGQIVRLLTQKSYDIQELKDLIDDDRLLVVIDELVKEQLVERNGMYLSLFHA
jgi:A/G-specific adenine glycosylase